MGWACNRWMRLGIWHCLLRICPRRSWRSGPARGLSGLLTSRLSIYFVSSWLRLLAVAMFRCGTSLVTRGRTPARLLNPLRDRLALVAQLLAVADCVARRLVTLAGRWRVAPALRLVTLARRRLVGRPPVSTFC